MELALLTVASSIKWTDMAQATAGILLVIITGVYVVITYRLWKDTARAAAAASRSADVANSQQLRAAAEPLRELEVGCHEAVRRLDLWIDLHSRGQGATREEGRVCDQLRLLAEGSTRYMFIHSLAQEASDVFERARVTHQQNRTTDAIGIAKNAKTLVENAKAEVVANLERMGLPASVKSEKLR